MNHTEEFTLLPCTLYAERESATMARWMRATGFEPEAANQTTPLEFSLSSRNGGGMELTPDGDRCVVRWSDGERGFVSDPVDDTERPTRFGGADPAVAFTAYSCALRDHAPTYPTDGCAGAICFSLREDPVYAPSDMRSAQLRFAWGGGDAGLWVDSAGSVLTLCVAGATLTLDAAWMVGRIMRYTVAWRIADGTMTVRVHGGPASTGSRSAVEATGLYPTSTAAAVPFGGAELSGRWVHVYALRWWQPPPSVEDWTAAVAALDAAWQWTSTVCDVSFDAGQTDAVVFRPPPHSTVVGAWLADPPNAGDWTLQGRLSFGTPEAPVFATSPRPGLKFGNILGTMDLCAYVAGFSAAGVVVLGSTPLAERPRYDPDFLLNLTMVHHNTGDTGQFMLQTEVRNNRAFTVDYHFAGRWQNVVQNPQASDGNGSKIYTVGWTMVNNAMHTWYVGEELGARSVVTRSGTIPRDNSDNNPEPDVLYRMFLNAVVLHEVRIVSPAPSPDDWAAVVTAVDQKWSAP